MTNSTHDDIVRESFRRQVGAFSGPDSIYAHREGPLAWVEPLDSSMIVLDVACGAAHAAEAVAPSVRQVVGIDLTPELLEVGTERVRNAAVGNVLLQEGNAEALPFVHGSFDLVFCRSSLHHFVDPRHAVEEMVRVTRPGGRVVLVDLIAPPDVDRDRFDHLHRLLDPSHVRTFVEDELGGVFPDEISLTYRATATGRLPIDIAVTDQSDRDTVIDALRREISGGEPTGFSPADEGGTIVVSFTTSTVHGMVVG